MNTASPELDSLRLVEDPVALVVAARWLGIGFLLAALVAVVVPWQQTALGEGTVTAYAPSERRQSVDAPVSGRVEEWHVQEGQRVEPGQLIATLVDNDPDRLSRLERQRETLLTQARAYTDKITATQGQLVATEQSLEQADARLSAEVSQSERELDAARVKLSAAKAEQATAKLQASRIQSLYDKGLSSQRENELAQLSLAKAEAEVGALQAALSAKQQSLNGKRASRQEKLGELRAKVEEVRSKLQDANSGEAEAQNKLLEIDGKLARQSAQVIRAPRAGQVLSIRGGQGGEQVKEGDAIVEIVPDASDDAVELWVDGQDMPLIIVGQQVRLQLEGWPAVQFAGWPSVAVGTFGGIVSAIDPSDDGTGRFRIWIIEDPSDDPWPESPWLRQGVRAKGWVLLGVVPLGYELWRQVNGFPPAVDRAKMEKEAKPPLPLPKGKK